MVNFPAAESHCPLTVTELYCLVTGAQGHEQLTQSHYIATPWLAVEPTTTQSSPAPDPLRHYATQFHLSHLCGSDVQRLTRCATMSPRFTCHTAPDTLCHYATRVHLSHKHGSDVQRVTRCATMPPRFTCHTCVGVMSSAWPVVPLCHPGSPVTPRLTRCATMPPGFTCHTRVGVMSSAWPVVLLCHPGSPITPAWVWRYRPVVRRRWRQ